MTEEKKPVSKAEDTAQANASQSAGRAPLSPAPSAAGLATLAKEDPEEADSNIEFAVLEESGAESREEQAKAVMYKYMMRNAALGFLPIPFIDVVTIGGTQLAMLAGISKVYGVDYTQHMAKPIVASLLGAIGYDFAVRIIAGALFKSIPVLGFVAGMATMPILGAASTYAVAKIFIQHFESGGTFLNFNAEEAKKYFTQYYKEGVQEAVGMKDKLLKPKAPAAAGEGN
ncbi:MAG: YcjF family protein [Vulcanimicrobiota bacterium]